LRNGRIRPHARASPWVGVVRPPPPPPCPQRNENRTPENHGLEARGARIHYPGAPSARFSNIAPQASSSSGPSGTPLPAEGKNTNRPGPSNGVAGRNGPPSQPTTVSPSTSFPFGAGFGGRRSGARSKWPAWAGCAPLERPAPVGLAGRAVRGPGSASARGQAPRAVQAQRNAARAPPCSSEKPIPAAAAPVAGRRRSGVDDARAPITPAPLPRAPASPRCGAPPGWGPAVGETAKPARRARSAPPQVLAPAAAVRCGPTKTRGCWIGRAPVPAAGRFPRGPAVNVGGEKCFPGNSGGSNPVAPVSMLKTNARPGPTAKSWDRPVPPESFPNVPVGFSKRPCRPGGRGRPDARERAGRNRVPLGGWAGNPGRSRPFFCPP